MESLDLISKHMYLYNKAKLHVNARQIGFWEYHALQV